MEQTDPRTRNARPYNLIRAEIIPRPWHTKRAGTRTAIKLFHGHVITKHVGARRRASGFPAYRGEMEQRNTGGAVVRNPNAGRATAIKLFHGNVITKHVGARIARPGFSAYRGGMEQPNPRGRWSVTRTPGVDIYCG
jgi:hypothetical protein